MPLGVFAMTLEANVQELADAIETLIRSDRLTAARVVIRGRHPADQADLIEELSDEARDSIVSAFSRTELAGLIEFLEPELRREVLAKIPPEDLAPVLDMVADDVAADIIQDLPKPEAEAVVPLLADRDVEQLLAYEEDTAGGRMSPDFIELHDFWTVDQAMNYLRRRAPNVDQPFYLYVVDDYRTLRGVVSLRNLVLAHPGTRLDLIMQHDPISVPVDYDQELAAERMRHYNLLALPVVDEDGRIRGVLTADDILDVQVEEATEDMYRMAGIGVKERAFSPVWESARRRVPWLAFNMVIAFAGASVIGAFTGTLDRLPALAIFMPMIAGQAGNAAIQTATIVVRSMALGEMAPEDAFPVLRKEWALGVIKGALFGAVLFAIAWGWQAHLTFGLIAGGAMFLNMLVASSTGVLLPVTLRRLGLDPATIAGVFDTMITDFMGFLIYLGLATLLITQLT